MRAQTDLHKLEKLSEMAGCHAERMMAANAHKYLSAPNQNRKKQSTLSKRRVGSVNESQDSNVSLFHSSMAP